MITKEEIAKYDAEKVKWLQTLRVGDIVCDCRYKHLKIAKIDEEYFPRFHRYIVLICYNDLFSARMTDYAYEKISSLFKLLNLKKLSDIQLTLEDGSMCSGFHCCSPPDHTH